MKTLYFPLSHQRNVPFYIGQKDSDHFAMIDQSKPSDLWFHLEDYPSCHIISSLPEDASREDTKKLILHGIRLSKEYSKHGNRVKVRYARIHQLTKGTHPGEVYVDAYS